MFCLARQLTGNVWRFSRQNDGNVKHFFDPEAKSLAAISR
jgi:hypothetical protein